MEAALETVVPVDLAERSYEIHIGRDRLDGLGNLVKQRIRGQRILLVSDTNVAPLHGGRAIKSLREAGLEAHLAVIPAGEGSKTLQHYSQLLDTLVAIKADRHSAVVALGGGVVGDLAGFVAASYARGIDFVQVPTTLLAMVDASVGGKVAVDHPRAKNMIGAFHQPTLVVCDLALLDSLPERDFRAGLAEVVKYGVIMDEEFFAWLEETTPAIVAKQADVLGRIVTRSCQLKAQVVAEDERETSGRRAILNYGHTYAHSFETASDYSLMLHGEAVAVGMVAAAKLAEMLDRCDPSLNQRQKTLWSTLGLPIRLPRPFHPGELLGIMYSDKKTVGGKLRLVLPTKIGHVDTVKDVDPEMVERSMLEVISG
ncbi:3-dehydroquinate synthase [Planctomycetes bacterium Pan216]